MTVARREMGTCDAKHRIATADLEARVLGGLQRLLVGNEDLPQTFADKFRAERKRLKGTRRKVEAKLRRELAEVKLGINRGLKFILSGEGAPTSVRAERQELEKSKVRIQAEMTPCRERARQQPGPPCSPSWSSG